MNSEKINKKLYPKQAIIIYADQKEYQPTYHLEARDIEQVGAKYILMAPVPMTEDVLKKVALNFMKNRSVDMNMNGIVPEHLIYASNSIGRTVVMWYRPAMKRLVNFANAVAGIGSATVNIPATLYLVINTKLYLFALMDSKRPDTKTKLYYAPFFNIYDDSNVCLGSARVGNRGKSYEDEVNRFESAFYMAEQTGGAAAQRCKTPLGKLWPVLAKGNKPFPSKAELKQHSKYKTVGELIEKLIGGKHND